MHLQYCIADIALLLLPPFTRPLHIVGLIEALECPSAVFARYFARIVQTNGRHADAAISEARSANKCCNGHTDMEYMGTKRIAL